MRKGIIYVDATKCLGCKRCYTECAAAHSPYGDFVELARQGGVGYSCIEYRPVGKMVVPIGCRHCEGAPCAVACPTGALGRKGKGDPVVLDETLCVGCRGCIVACPYGAIRTSKRSGKIYKCDLCIQRTSMGRKPACTEACPTGCLRYETTDLLDQMGPFARDIEVRMAQAATESSLN